MIEDSIFGVSKYIALCFLFSLSSRGINNLLEAENQKIVELLSNEIEKIVDKHIGKSEDILVVGLGNLYSTPDSLGSKVVKKIEITRHIKKYIKVPFRWYL